MLVDSSYLKLLTSRYWRHSASNKIESKRRKRVSNAIRKCSFSPHFVRCWHALCPFSLCGTCFGNSFYPSTTRMKGEDACAPEPNPSDLPRQREESCTRISSSTLANQRICIQPCLQQFLVYLARRPSNVSPSFSSFVGLEYLIPSARRHVTHSRPSREFLPKFYNTRRKSGLILLASTQVSPLHL